MAIKFNKELMLKHRFWVMLGVTVVLALIGIGYLEAFVDTELERKKYDDALKKQKGIVPKINQKGIQAFQDVINEDTKNETKIWSAAYAEEEPLFRWPSAVEEKFNFASGYFATDIKLSKMPDAKTPWPKDVGDKDTATKVIYGTLDLPQMEHGFYLKRAKGSSKVLICPIHTDTVKVTLEDGKPIEFGKLKDFSAGKLLAVTYQKGRYFNDPITTTEQVDFAASYKDQVHDILKLVDPLDEKGNGVVQLKDWLYAPTDYPDPSMKFIRFVDEPWNVNKPVYKEAWIAQEDLWIQKEIYRMIADANRKISDFKGEGGKKVDTTYKFANPNFNVELTLDAKGMLTFKIKNRLDRQQALDLNFRVLLNNSRDFAPELMRISGDPLKPAGDKTGKDSYVERFPIGKSPRNAIVSVQQVLTWQTAAVKRIDQITIGDAGDQAHSHRTFGDAPLRPFDPKDGEDAKAVKGGFRPPPGKKGKGPAAPIGPAPVALGANMGGLEHGFWTHRYSEVTDQMRRIPVAVVLIVDQDHVDRVLTSFNNSKLRFLPTQVLLNQYPGSLQPPAVPGKDDEAPVRPLPGQPRVRPVAPPPPQAGASSDTETNMELVIYGIMTLYQRYPKAPVQVVVPVEKKN